LKQTSKFARRTNIIVFLKTEQYAKLCKKYYSSTARFKRTVLGGSGRVREKTFIVCQCIYKVIEAKPLKASVSKCLKDSIQEPFENSLSASPLVLSVQPNLPKNNNGPGDEVYV
jgi:hypothetical protein